MSTAAVNWVVAGGAAISALGIIWATLRRLVRAVVDFVRVARELLALQPRVVELAEQLVELVQRHGDHELRLSRVEAAVFPTEKEISRA